jgi:hypothetical protein
MKRKIIAVAAVAIIVTVAVFAYTHTGKPHTIKNPDKNSSEYKSLLANTPANSLGTTPAGVLTPTEFSKTSNKYLNKEVSLRGVLLKLSGGSYALVDIGVNDAKGLIIYQGGTDLHLDKYAVDTSNSSKQKAADTSNANPVIITGTRTTDRPANGNPVTAKFVATALKQQ